MTVWIPWLIAIASLTGFLCFWFRDVRRIMRERRSVVESAESQLLVCRKKAESAAMTTESAAVLDRSRSIYRQAVDIYNQTLKRPWVCVPAFLMGYRSVQ